MIKLTKLQNGLKILTQSVQDSNTVTLGYLVKCGSYHENNDNLGIAHFTEHMLFKGTLNRSKDQINYDLESVGGMMNAYTSFDHTKYWCTIPSTHLDKGIDVLSDLIWNNTIPEDEFDKERNVILEELKMYNDDPFSRVNDLTYTSIFRDYKNRQLVGGTIESVKKITRNQMIEFIDKYYSPSNIILIASGNVNHSELCEFVKNYIGDVEINSKDIQIDNFNGFASDINRNVVVDDSLITQSHLKWELIFDGNSNFINDKNFAILEIISTILGGNSSSRLYSIIREEKGLAYTVSCDCDIIYDMLTLGGYVGLDKENIESVKSIILEEINKIKNEKINSKDLNAAKEYLKGSLLVSLESTRGKNNYLCSSIMYKFNLSYVDYIETINSITSEDIYEFVNSNINIDEMFFVSLVSKQ